MPKTEKHLATLDAMRGIAAFAVCLFHLSYGWPRNLLPHAYLAVDFFFALSGFVIARAYEERLFAGMGAARFMWLRLVRLYPLIALGLALGLADEVLKTHAGSLRLAQETLFNAMLLPADAAAHWPMFPLNPPTWSLFYELLVNLAFAVALLRMRDRGLYAIMAVSALWIAWVGWTTGQTGGGEALGEWQGGASRVLFSFTAGMVLHRLESRGAFARLPKISGLWLCAVLALSLAVAQFHADWVYNLGCIMLLFPLLVALGARRGNLPEAAVPAALWLGRISYPIYVLHYPLLVRNSYRITHGEHGIVLAGIIIAVMLGITLLSWAALVFYDEPVRAWLGRAGKARRHTAGAIAPASGTRQSPG